MRAAKAWTGAFLSIVLFGVVPQAVYAAAAQPFSLDAVRVDTPPKIDGTLDDPLWQKAAHAQLEWDYSFQRPASEQTDAYVLMDAQHVYVAFVAKQAEPITATLRTNNVTLAADDVVRIYLWPGGDHGFEYVFAATPIGTRNQISTENSAFTPTWTAVAKTTPSGYIVTMQIPLKVMRSDGRKSWRLQFDRGVHATKQTFEWSHSGSQQSTDDSTAIGFFEGVTASAGSTRTKPRIGVYALGQAASQRAGGSTSRMGADFAFPITPTASFIGTIHPDYSNVELDQQTISPTAFPRQFTEIRPFFTQGSNFYNNFNCNDCPVFPLLYTPSIPTPRTGFAVEGVQGLLNFAGFAAIGNQRTDAAQAMRWTSADHRYSLIAQHQTVTTLGLIDNTMTYQARVGNAHNFSVYETYSQDRGTGVTDPSLGNMNEFGLNLYTPKSGFFPAWHNVGAMYAPADAFVSLADVRGPSLYTFREFDFAPQRFIQSVTVSEDLQRYRNQAGLLGYANSGSGLTILTRNQLSLSASSGTQYLVLFNGTAATINQNGATLGYGTSGSLPSTISYNVGRFGNGYLHTTTRTSSIKAGQRGTLSFEADDTDFLPDSGVREVQWLERASYAFHFSAESSLAIGLRRIIGTAPPLTPAPRVVNAGNVTMAYYRKSGQNELYLAYGSPNTLATKPALILKLIRYFGAEKGS
ncbi:MAG TPA: sugar-binding protein [Candidatus Tumulicola sp.]|nr:sugar-binding protein [Candidatus Tumulicola sp.]